MAEQSLLRRYLHASGINLLAQVVYYAIYFVSIRMILSALSKEENGQLVFVQQWASTTLSTTLLMGYTTYALQHLSHFHRRIQLFSTLFWLRFVLTLATALALTITLKVIAGIDPLVTLLGVAAVSVMPRGNALRTTLEQAFHALLRFRLSSMLAVIDVTLLAGFLLWWRSNLDVQHVFGAQLLAGIPSTILLVVLLWREGTLQLTIDHEELHHIRQSLIHIGILPLALTAHVLLDITALELLSNRIQVGIFGATQYAGMPIQVLFTVLSTPLIPALVEKQRSDPLHFPSLMQQSLRLIVFVLGITAIVIAAFAPMLLDLLSAGVYRQHTTEFILQTWVAVGAVYHTLLTQYHLVLGNFRRAAATMLALVVGSLVFDWYLAGVFGAVGLLLAKLGSITLAITIAITGLQAHHMPHGRRTAVLISAWLVTSASTTIALMHYLPTGIALLGSVVCSMILAAGYRVVCWDDRHLLARYKRYDLSAS